MTSLVLSRIRTGVTAQHLPSFAQYALAAAAILAIAVLRTILFSDFPAWFLFTPAIIVIAMFLGGGSGLVATLLATVGAGYVLLDIEPIGRLSPFQWAATALFALVNVGLVGLVVAMRRALLEADASRAAMARHVVVSQEREAFLAGILSSSTDCIKVLDLDGKLSFMSEGGQRVMEVSDFNAIAGCPWPDFWVGTGHAEAVDAVCAARAGVASSFVGRASTLQGNPRWWHVAVSPILGPDGRPDRILSVSRDITALRESEEARDRFVRLVENSADFIGMAHIDGRAFFLNDAAKRMVGLEAVDVATLTIADFFTPEQMKTVTADMLAAVDRDGYWSGETTIRHFSTGELIPMLQTVFPVTDPDGLALGYGTVARDFRARKRAEEELRLMNGELAHRLKNVLAVVQSVAQQTLRSAPDVQTAGRDLSARLVALGSATDVLTDAAWRSADLRQVAERTLAPHGTIGERIRLDGPAIALRPQVVVALALALHELATNAAKYGALANDTGLITLAWQVEGDGPEAGFSLTWRESGGPPVTAPTRRGFGSTLIDRALRSYFDGSVTTAYHLEGFAFRLEAALDATAVGEEGV